MCAVIFKGSRGLQWGVKARGGRYAGVRSSQNNRSISVAPRPREAAPAQRPIAGGSALPANYSQSTDVLVVGLGYNDLTSAK
ncbi:unnamed protein product [Pieris brassicae]|uniref:Uncharacterized protein n=1 Tax=Pieris brassicae TaxID=7116 RepID=A0A9P0U0V4_PIEBR|nr:unnamed protein product [Pieris brassicae]